MGPYDVVAQFEKTIAEYAGSDYGVAVDSCCNAIFLCCLYERTQLNEGHPIEYVIPARTYPGVACAIINSGNSVKFSKSKWEEFQVCTIYKIGRNIIDGALFFREGMYFEGYHCLSFHAKKHLAIGRGGMILTDDDFAVEWFKRARFDGRSAVPLHKDKIEMVGFNMYMTPDQAARGLMLFDAIKDKFLMPLKVRDQKYPDLSKIKAYQ